MEDNLMRIFASDRIRAMMGSLGMQNGEAIEHRWVTKSIERAQRKVEGHNFDIRKNLLEYDDVANDQRQVIYRQRDELMAAEDISETVLAMRGRGRGRSGRAVHPHGSGGRAVGSGRPRSSAAWGIAKRAARGPSGLLRTRI